MAEYKMHHFTIKDSNNTWEIVDEAGRSNIAKQFDINTLYHIGDYCRYNGALYRFITEHPYRSWSALDVEEVALADQLSNIKNDIKETAVDEIQSQIGQITSDWLNENLKFATGVVDASLSLNNVAADSATVGARLETLDSQVGYNTENISNLQEQTSLLDIALGGKVDNGYVEDGVAYFTSNGETLFSITGIGGGGQGGGGSSGNNAVITATNTTGWISKTISYGYACNLSFNWTSLEDDQPTGSGSMTITVNGTAKAIRTVQQGDITVNITNYLSTGQNIVKIKVTDVYDNSKTLSFSITMVALTLTSSFNTESPFTGQITFPYVPTGNVEKIVHFIVDGTEIGTQTTSVSGRQQTFTIPAQTHGSHSLRVYYEATIAEQTVLSNELFYDIIYIEEGNNTPIISSVYNQDVVTQYTAIAIPYYVYNPTELTAEIILKANGNIVSTLTVDRTQHIWTYRAIEMGELTLTIQCGNTTKTFVIDVTESDISAKAETENLALHLTSLGRSNNEADPSIWKYNDIAATLSNFNYASDGWVLDDENNTVLRVTGKAEVEIPYQIFAEDFKSTGKTIEFQFTTRDVRDYDSIIVECWSNNRGIKITPQKMTIKSEQTELFAQYKENQHVRVSFVISKISDYRLIFCYINGIISAVAQYPSVDDFQQSNPANIHIGSQDCTTDIYNIRIYDNALTLYQMLDNWIADTQNVDMMLARYRRNNIFNEYNSIVIDKLPSDLPYMIIDAEQLPQFKGDKKTVSGRYVDPLDSSKSFTFTGCQINVQGTSSAGYVRKNYDMQFKKGFTIDDAYSDNYVLGPNIVPFNRFVLKADVASSEGANNVELVKLYCDLSPFQTREHQADPRVRMGIYGFPIVLFWHDTVHDEVQFMGKYNFNLPKRAPGPYGYSGDMESWQFQNNTSELMLFKTDYFDETMYTDPDTKIAKEVWRYDYEARFPSDEWTDYTKLQELQSFIYSTYREEATGDNLDSPVVYDGVTYTADTADYRLAKFKNEFKEYAEVDSFIFYYIFTELFLLVDSRAKNLFIGFSGSDTDPTKVRYIDRKAVAEPYDMDTGLGINNEGALVFSYNLQDTDTVESRLVFNGQTSVLWNNIRDAFEVEIQQMYQNLRSGNILSYDSVEQRFEDHQSKWSEAIFNQDAYFKYLQPLFNDNDSSYLHMLQGSKAEQRKWWLYNRFRYMDSKWNAGDANTDRIELRGYDLGSITVTPYADIYPTIKYGSYMVSARGQRKVPTTLVPPPQIDVFNDTQIYIYSAPQIADIGDLSPLKVGRCVITKAEKLQRLKIGDSDPNYDNPNMDIFSVGNNPLLKSIDARNCSGLGLKTTKSIDLKGCTGLEEAYFTGTNLSGLTFPNGGVINTLHLPDTMTSLIIQNQPNITEFVMDDFSNITTLVLENAGSIMVNSKDIVSNLVVTQDRKPRVRLIGVQWEAEDSSEISELYDILDTMGGLDETLTNNMPRAQISGTIHVPALTGEEITNFSTRYPNLKLLADHISTTIYFYNGSTLITQQTVLDGGDATYTGTTPTKTQDAQYTYSFSGWSKENDNTVDADALTAITADRNVYACYTGTLRKYSVYFVKSTNDGGGTLQTLTDIPYGTSITAASRYTGTTPTTTQGDATDYPFEGWTPASATVTGNTTFTAKFKDPYLEPETITDSWETILANENYATDYSIGDTKMIDLGEHGKVLMQIAAFDTDALPGADAGTAGITWIARNTLPNVKQQYYSGSHTGSYYSNSTIASFLSDTVFGWMPSILQNNIKTVRKRAQGRSSSGIVSSYNADVKLFIPSHKEVTGLTTIDTDNRAIFYSGIFSDENSRIRGDSGVNGSYWLRSIVSSGSAQMIDQNGADTSNTVNGRLPVVLGFCTN